MLGTTLLGVAAGDGYARTPTPCVSRLALQAALLGLVALILAFGLTLAVGRYDSRRAAVVDTANDWHDLLARADIAGADAHAPSRISSAIRM